MKWTRERSSRAQRIDCRCFKPTRTSSSVDLTFKNIHSISRCLFTLFYFMCFVLSLEYCYAAHIQFTIHPSQVCSINMTVGRFDKPTTLLFPKDLLMEQDQDMTLFQMTKWCLSFRNETDPSDGIWMTVVLKRKIMSEMMSTFLLISQA